MEDLFEIGTISSRGQIAVPSNMRKALGLEDGSRVIFMVANDTLLLKKVTAQTFAHVTKPLKEAAKQAGLKETDSDGLVQRFRKRK